MNLHLEKAMSDFDAAIVELARTTKRIIELQEHRIVMLEKELRTAGCLFDSTARKDGE